MQPVELLLELRKKFSTTKAQQIIPSLRRDSIIWASLQNEAFFNKMVAFAGDEVGRWSPAHLAVLSLIQPERDESMLSMVEKAQQAAAHNVKLFDETRQVVRQPKTLVEAATLALAMQKRFPVREHEPIRPLLLDLMPLPGEPEHPALLIWQTPLACLLGMVANPLDVLRSLMPKRISSLPQQWVNHAVFTNPYDDEQKIDIFTSLLSGLPPAQQLSWLRQVNLTGAENLVVEIARRLLTKTSISSAQLLSKTNLDMVDIETAIVRCLELQRLAGLYRFANQPSNAKVMLQKAQSIVQHWLAGLGVQDADLALQEGQMGAVIGSLRNALTLGGSSNGMQSEILLSVPQNDQAEMLVEQLSEQTSNPISQIFIASQISQTGEIEFAREMASRAVELWLQQIERQPLPFSPQFAMEWHPLTLIQVLVKLNLPQQAMEVAYRLQELRPTDAQLSYELSKIFDLLSDTRQALLFAQLTATLKPDVAVYHAWLSGLWGKLGEWALAYHEQHQAVFLVRQPEAKDWSLLARCAVELKDWVKVEEAADQALTLNPDFGSALAMKGQSYLETGKLEEAGRFLSRATLLAPEEAETWLQLARLYLRLNNRQRALETLRAAALAVPSSAEINFALARECLETGLTSDALPLLRRAAALDPASVDIAVNLGQTLCILGHISEALHLIEQARSRWPQHPSLAFTHAQAALANNNRETALKALEVALESGNAEFDWYILFARTILGKDLFHSSDHSADYSWVIKAEQALDKALQMKPQDYETQLLRAEITHYKGNDELAYQLFEKLMEQPEFHSIEFRWRVQAGLGQVSLALQRYESALASLQEAVQDQPENVQLQHLLAEAYFQSQLIKQALTSARYGLKLAPDDLENLTWFANFMTRAGEIQEAIQALRTATQLAPQMPIYWFELAALFLKQDDHNAATDHLKRLLQLEHIPTGILLQTAAMFNVLGNPEAVLESLLRIATPNAGILVEIAYFALQTGQLEPGLNAIQEAARQDSEETAVYVIEADLLNGLKRPEAGLACLEHALHLFEGSIESSKEISLARWAEVKSRGLVPHRWINFVQTREAVHERLAQFFNQMGDFISAGDHAEQALELAPTSFSLRLQAAEINEIQLHIERLEKILANMPLEINPDEGDSDEILARACLLSMKAEYELDRGKVSESAKFVAQANLLAPGMSRSVATLARLAAREGEWQKANDLLGNCPGCEGAWIGKAALELSQWDRGLSCLETLVANQPVNMTAQYWFARGLATAALAHKSGVILNMTAHLPGKHVIGKKAQEQFERASLAAVKDSNREALRWQVIGNAIFQPGLDTIRSLAAVLPGESEAAALVAVLREISNLPGAIQVAEQYHDSPEVLFQLALSYVDQETKRGLDAARKLVALRPNQPVFQVVRAKLCQKAHQDDEAMAALEAALEMWPEEAEWHVWASKQAAQLDLADKVIAHWQKALEIVPQRKPYAISAAKAFLAYHQEQKAIAVLEEAIEDPAVNSEAYYLLGSAYYQSGQLKQALSCAENAVELDRASIDAVLLCGEISLAMGRSDDALAWGQKAVSIDDRQADAILFLAFIYEKRNNPQEALNIVQGALQKNLLTQELQVERARLVFMLNGAASALTLLKELDAAYPDQVSILKLLAQATMEVGDLPGAEKIAFQALKLDAEQPSVNLLMGKLHRLSGQLDQSIHFLSEAIRQAPGQAEAYLELGQAYLDRREPGQALQAYQKAMKKIPQDFKSFYQAGLLLREGKDYHGAETMLRRAAELAPDDLNIRRQLGAVITLNLIHSSQEASSNNETQRTQR